MLEFCDHYDERLIECALVELVDDMMRGEEFPQRVSSRLSTFRAQINLVEVLMHVDREELALAVFNAVTDAPEDLNLDITKLVKAYFEGDGKKYVLAKAEELRAQAEKLAEDDRAEAMLCERRLRELP